MTINERDNLIEQLEAILQHIQADIDADIDNGTVIPGRYNEIQELIDQAEDSLHQGDIETALDLIGEINLDALEQVDELDDTISEVIKQLRTVQQKYIADGKPLPREIHEALNDLKAALDRHAIPKEEAKREENAQQK